MSLKLREASERTIESSSIKLGANMHVSLHIDHIPIDWLKLSNLWRKRNVVSYCTTCGTDCILYLNMYIVRGPKTKTNKDK